MIKQKLNCAPVLGPGGDRSGTTRKANALLGWASPWPSASLTARGWEESWAGLAQLCHLQPDWKLHGRRKRQRMPNPAETRTIMFLSKSSSSWTKLSFETAMAFQSCGKCTLTYKILAAFVMGTANCTAFLFTCRCEGGGSVCAPAKAVSTRGGGTLPLLLLPVSQKWRADTDKSFFTVNQDKQDAPLCPQMSQKKHKARKLRLYIILGYFHLSPCLS